MDDGFVVVSASRQKDPDGSKLRGFLQSHLALERAQSFRDLFVHMLALASLPLGFLVARPAGAATGFRSATLAGVYEWRYRRRCAALKEDLGPP